MGTSSLRSLINGSRISRVGMRALTIFTAMAVISTISAATAVVAAKRYENRNKPRLVAGGKQQGRQQAANSSGDDASDQGDVGAGTPGAVDNGTGAAAGGGAAGSTVTSSPTG